MTKAKLREPLGAWGALTLDQARSAARVRLGQVAAGVNPRAVRLQAKAVADAKAAADRLTLDALIEQWSAQHLSGRRPSYRAEAEGRVRHVFAKLLSRPAASITKADVRAELDKMTKRGKVTTAARTLAYGRACYGWAVKRDMLDANPFRGLPIPPANAQRERTLDTAEAREVWAAAGTLGYPYGPAIRLLLLTMARREEVSGMAWSELEADGSRWVIPSARTKNGRPHVVHLAAAARAVLASVPRVKGQDLVFSVNGHSPVSAWPRAKAALDAAVNAARAANGAEPMPSFVIHDFRRTGVSWLASAGFDVIVADKLLNHQPSSLRGVAAVYQRHSFDAERARALDAWAGQLMAEPGGNVVALRAVG